MRVAFRVDGSVHIGSGHLTRCLTLAQALVAHGARVLFVSRAHQGHLLAYAGQQGFTVLGLPAPLGVASDSAVDPYAAWRGVTEEADAAETVAALRSTGHAPLDWLVVDHYGVGIGWEQALARYAGRLLVIDDLERLHQCQLLLDQNFCGPRTLERYRDRVPAECVRMLGPSHALLQTDYAHLYPGFRR